jgi:hypothetical protein
VNYPISVVVDPYTELRCSHEAGVLAYFLRRTRSAELSWDLAAETWAAVGHGCGRRGVRDQPPPEWVFAVARETLCRSLRAGRVVDDARRRAGVGPVELTEAGARWVREAATEECLAQLVAGLQPALREAVMAPVPLRDAADMAARLRRRPPGDGQSERRERRFAPLLGRLRVAR